MPSCPPTGTENALLPRGAARFVCALILLATIGYAQAASFQWNGNGGNVNWTTGTNWIGGVAPPSNSSTTDLTFSGVTNTGSLAAPLSNSANPFQLNSLTFSSGAGNFFLGGSALSFVGTGTNPNTIFQLSSNAQNIANNINNPGNKPTTLTLAGSGIGVVTLSGVISSGSGGRDYAVTKTGTSTFTLSGANTYGGATTISAGVLNIQNNLALGQASGTTSVASGAALQIQGGYNIAAEPLTLNGSGIANDGALRNISGANSFGGPVTFGSATTIASDAGTLTLGGGVNNGGFLFTESGAGNVTISGVLSGTGGLTKNGAGTLTLNGAAVNTYTGATTVNQGTLVLATLARSTAGPAITIGGAGSTATVQLGVNFQIYGANTTINSQGQLNLNGFQEYIGTLTLNGGSVVTGTGLLYIGGTGITSTASNVTSALTGNYSLVTNQIFNIATGTTPTGVDVIISGPIGEVNALTTITKQGAGKIVLSGANAYTGLTTISAGVLNIQNGSALGTNATGTTVSSGAALQIEGGISVGTETLTLNGGGIASDGALRNISGNNSFGGAITLGSASTISSDLGTLTLGGGITNGGFLATFTGSGNVTESGAISGLGGITKTGNGTLTLGGANGYLGSTTINGGTLAVSSNGNLGGLASTINLNAGTLEITTGFSTARTFSLGNSASTVQVDAGQTFTVTSVIAGPGALNKTGSGTLILNGMNLFSGGTTVTGGTLQLGVINALLSTASVMISGGTLDLQTFGQTTGAVTLSSGTISGSSGALTGASYTLQSGSVSAILGGNSTVTKNTSGSVTLSAANTFTGSTTISAGTLQVNTNNALGTAASGTTVASGAVLTLNNVNYTTAEPLTLNGSGISNGGALLNIGTSTFAGPINAATNATINAGGGTLNLTGGLSKNGTTLTITGGGTVSITTNGITGSLANSDLVVDNVTLDENAPNSYQGPTYIRNGGILNANVANALPTANGRSAVFLDDSGSGGSQLALGAPQAAASLTGISSSLINLNGNTLTIGNAAGSTTFAGIISGTGGLIKDNASTQILSGTNTFSGSTTVNGGTLIAANGSGSAALGSTSNVTVNSGGTFLLGANDQVNNTATLTLAGGTFAKGDFSEGTAGSPGVGALTLTATGSHIDFGTGAVGVLTFASFTPGSFTLTIDNWTGTPSTLGTGSTDRLIFASDQSANLSSFSFTGYGPGAVEFALPNGYWEVAAVPVPETSTWVAAALALGAAGWHLLRRHSVFGTVRLRKSPGKFPK